MGIYAASLHCKAITHLILFKHYKLEKNYNERNQKKKDGKPVDPVHVFHPLRMRRIRISFFQVEIFGDLAKKTHAQI
jgi:hypothetical protein